MTDTPSEQAQSDLDYLMSLNPLDYKDGDIDAIIAYQRKFRHQLEGGNKPARKKAAGEPGKKIDLTALGLVPPKEAPKPAGPSPTGGLRRI